MVTASWANTLKQHKPAVIELVAARDWKPWWDKSLSAAENMSIEDFMQFSNGDPEAIPDWEHGPVESSPCTSCGFLLSWWDMMGGQHCLRCEPPLTSIRLVKQRDEILKACS